jgi:hypothetical protein
LKVYRYLSALVICIIIAYALCFPAFAGSYTVSQTISGSFSDENASIRNKLGYTMNVHPYEFTNPVTNVNIITGNYRANSVVPNIYIMDIDVYYNNGSGFLYGTRIENIQVSRLYTYRIDFDSSLKTIYSIAFVPNLLYVPAINYAVGSPRFTRILNDDIPPSIILTEQSEYSNTSVTITANISDSESGVEITKWTVGNQAASFFSSEGTEFSGSFSVNSGGIVTVYAKDKAGNETVVSYTITKYDIFVPVISTTTSNEYNPTNIITVSITDSQSGISVRKWAYGSYTASYFSTAGNALPGNTITAYTNGTYSIYAKDIAGNENVAYITVTYVDNTISVTHPISVSFSINPNILTPYRADDISLINNSRIKVRVSIAGLNNSTAGGKPAVVSPSFFTNWSSLTAYQTKSYIALGVKIKETSAGSGGWYSILNSSVIYGSGIINPVPVGILNANGARGSLVFDIRYGLAWDSTFTAAYSLTLIFDTG